MSENFYVNTTNLLAQAELLEQASKEMKEASERLKSGNVQLGIASNQYDEIRKKVGEYSGNYEIEAERLLKLAQALKEIAEEYEKTETLLKLEERFPFIRKLRAFFEKLKGESKKPESGSSAEGEAGTSTGTGSGSGVGTGTIEHPTIPTDGLDIDFLNRKMSPEEVSKKIGEALGKDTLIEGVLEPMDPGRLIIPEPIVFYPERPWNPIIRPWDPTPINPKPWEIIVGPCEPVINPVQPIEPIHPVTPSPGVSPITPGPGYQPITVQPWEPSPISPKPWEIIVGPCDPVITPTIDPIWVPIKHEITHFISDPQPIGGDYKDVYIAYAGNQDVATPSVEPQKASDVL